MRETARREITFFVPTQTKNPLNNREHWRKVSRRAAEEKELTVIAAPKHTRVVLPCVVVMTRCSQRTMDSHDGVRAALKHIADGVAEWVGVDDRESDVLRFQYEQERCPKGQNGVRIRVVQGARVVETIELVDGVEGGPCRAG
jgi:hypothetical protein